MTMTAIMVEFLIAGILILLALLLFTMSLFPTETQIFFVQINEAQIQLVGLSLIITVFISVAYGFGVLFEYIGMVAFEWWFAIVKARRFSRFIALNSTVLEKSSFLKEYVDTSSEEEDANNKEDGTNKQEMRSAHGAMRFYVLMKSSTLYSEIKSQLDRVRLIRILFFVELILLFAVIIQLNRGFSLTMRNLGIIISLIMVLNIAAINNRFHRYCRAIERSYKMLILHQNLEGGVNKSTK